MLDRCFLGFTLPLSITKTNHTNMQTQVFARRPSGKGEVRSRIQKNEKKHTGDRKKAVTRHSNVSVAINYNWPRMFVKRLFSSRRL